MENEELNPQKGQPQNLQTVQIAEYSKRFELELNYKNSLHPKKLIIQKNGYIYETDREEKIDEDRSPLLKKSDDRERSKSPINIKQNNNYESVIKNEKPNQIFKFSAFLGIQHIMDQAFLFGCSKAIHICTIERHDIFEINEVFFIPFQNDFKNDQETKDKFKPYFEKLIELFREGYYFSYTYDLSQSKIKQANKSGTQMEFCWNRQMCKQLWEVKVSKIWTIPLMQGYVGYFSIFLEGKKLNFCLLARRSSYRAGTRFNARGLDDNGHVANYVELEQIIYYANYCCSSLQIRGSVPLFWQQRGVTTQTKINRSDGLTIPSFLKHLDYMRLNYQHIFSVNLMKANKPDEQIVTSNYERILRKQNLSYLKYHYFDLHHVCKGDKYEKVNPVIEGLSSQIANFKYYCEDLRENNVLLTQKGIFRTNCLDCLDRTNVFQTKIALEIFDHTMKTFKVDLEKIFGETPLLHQDNPNHKENHPFMSNFKNVWADCGDAISKHYTGTGSTHTDVTKKGKRDFPGRISHGLKSLNRFLIMNFYDNIKQEAIDLVVGEVTETANEFEEQLQTQLAKRKEEYITQNDVTIFITTYNIDGYECPKQENTEIFNFNQQFKDNGTPDIVVIALQEIDNSYFGGNNTKLIQNWNEFILKNLNKFDNYVQTKQKDYVNNLTLVFSKIALNHRIKKVQYDTQSVGYGLFKQMKLQNNRGAVSIQFLIDDSSFCFTNVHLESNPTSRVSNINEIHNNAFQVATSVGKTKDMKISECDYKFLLGDFQYSIRLEQQEIEKYIAQYEISKKNKQITKADDSLAYLLQKDDFNLEKNQSIFLKNYEEGELNFMPTYKYAQHSGIYDKKSIPSWRDRILHWTNYGNKFQVLQYKRNEVRFSSHRPISGFYKCTVSKFDQDKRQQIIEEIYTQLNSNVQVAENNMDESEKKYIPDEEYIISEEQQQQ